jgi:hypothetical protein
MTDFTGQHPSDPDATTQGGQSTAPSCEQPSPPPPRDVRTDNKYLAATAEQSRYYSLALGARILQLLTCGSLKIRLKQALRQFPDFPSEGILFEDILPIFKVDRCEMLFEEHMPHSLTGPCTA